MASAFDFMLNPDAINEGAFIPESSNITAPENLLPANDVTPSGPGTTAPGKFDFLSDPNIIRAMAEAGSGFSQGKGAGEVLGGVASNLTQRRGLQKASAKGSQQQANLLGDIRAALRGDPTGKNLLGPKEDLETLDSITLTNDGINIKAPNKDKTDPFSKLEDKSALTTRSGGGSDSRNF